MGSKRAKLGGLPPGKGARLPAGQEPGKTARFNEPVAGPSGPVFCFKHTDRASENPWKFDLQGDDARLLIEFLGNMGRLTWSEIERQQTGGKRRHRKHHSQEISGFDAEAQKDAQRLRLSETFGDEMFRFRLAGECRLWGFRSGSTFHAIWWDPDHKVYPTSKS